MTTRRFWDARSAAHTKAGWHRNKNSPRSHPHPRHRRAVFFAYTVPHPPHPTQPPPSHLYYETRKEDNRERVSKPHEIWGWRRVGADGRRCSLRVLTTASLEAERSGDFRNYASYPSPPSTIPNRNYSKGKLAGSLRKSPWIVSTVPVPTNYCSSSPWGEGGKGENALGVAPGESQEGTRRDHRMPRLARSPHPVPCPPGPRPRPPAGRKRSLCGRDSRGCPFPARPALSERFPPHLSSSGVWGSRAEPAVVSTRKLATRSRRVRRLGRAPHSRVREAASPRKGALVGASSSP